MTDFNLKNENNNENQCKEYLTFIDIQSTNQMDFQSHLMTDITIEAINECDINLINRYSKQLLMIFD